jgi:phosphoribosyl 1,2-cyclic phosphodiesterase
MRVCVLGSSSSGNAVFLAGGATRLLIDTGNLPVFTHIRRTLAAIGEDWMDLDAILISHAHGDHLNGNTFSIAFRTGTPVYVPRRVAAWLEEAVTWLAWPYLGRCLAAGLVRPLDGEAALAGLVVRTFALPHDIDPTRGFVVTDGGGRRVGVATDLGHCPPPVVEQLRDCDVLVFEANHDVAMERASGRDEALIARVLGPRGHLSNDQSAEALCEIVGTSRRRRPAGILLAHISRDCNRPDLACRTVSAALHRHRLQDVRVEPTHPRQRSAVVRVV